MISLDCETTGLDLRHGARPFLVTTCREGEDPVFWEWFVDPLTRVPIVPPEDVEAIGDLFANGPEEFVLQNAKFDFAALETLGLWKTYDVWQIWQDVKDTLRAGHLLASNQPHDLTTMALIYLGQDISPLEEAVVAACNEARRLARSKFPEWKIAKDGLEGMPSAKGSVGKYDMWLPRAIAKELKYPDDHPWWTVTSKYANMDSAVTVPLYRVMEEEIKRRGYWEIYLECLRVQSIAYRMERDGLTVNKRRLAEKKKEYGEESAKCHAEIMKVAKSYNYPLELPKGAVNNSMRKFCFDVLKLEPIRNPKAKSEAPSLDSKNAIPHYLATLPPKSRQMTFIKNLVAKRARDVAVSYMEAYVRFGVPLLDDWFRLHPNLNPTGTDTLRWSSNNPNEQNISKREGFNLRYCFGPAPGREWWSMDAKNIELRIPAYESGEQALIDIFEKPDDPPFYGSNHLLNFSIVYPDIWEEETTKVGIENVGPHCKKVFAATWYQRCKNGGFKLQYGGLDADSTFCRAGATAALRRDLENMERLNQHWIGFAKTQGYVETMPDKTVNAEHGYPLLCSRTSYGGIKPTVPLNYHVQSTAMWWMMKAMIRCQEQLSEWFEDGFDGRIALQVHDELVFDLPKKSNPLKNPKGSNLWRIKKLKALMEQGGEDLLPRVPTPVGVEYHSETWDRGEILCLK